MKLPLKASAIGLLLGIAVAFILSPYLGSTSGIALLLVLCVLATCCIGWAWQALFGKGK